MDTSTKQHYVYKITCLETGEYYYGKRSCNGSWKDDPYMGSGQILKRKIKAHPEYTWTKEVLLLLDSIEEALEYEAVVIGNKFKGGEDWDGLCLNLTAGGLGSRGCSPSEETRAKLSRAGKGKKKPPLTEEARINMSTAQKGKTHSEETRAKMSEAHKGKSLSEEHRSKIGEAAKGNQRALGVVRSEETRAKMSEAQKGNQNWLGKTHSEETRAKMREAALARAAKKRAEKALTEN